MTPSDTVEAIIADIAKTIKQGTALWRAKKKSECCTLYKNRCNEVIKSFAPSHPCTKRLATSLAAAAKQQPGVGAVTLRKALDAFVKEQNAALAKEGKQTDKSEGRATEGTTGKEKEKATRSSGATEFALQKKVKQLEAQVNKDKQQMERMKESLHKSESEAKEKAAANHDAASSAKSVKRATDALDKKHKKEVEAAEKRHSGEISKIQAKLKRTEAELAKANEELENIRSESAALHKRSANLKSIEKELAETKVIAEEVGGLRSAVADGEKRIEKLNADYSEEKRLRKKYWNMMEDMKGKIRVYARCRPFNGMEKEKNSGQAVHFIDDTSLELNGPRGKKEFTYDGVFTASETQEEVYEDTSHLITSAIDGYNVCLFAYGQTGSGKTWTMTGDVQSEADRGITPRAMKQLYEEIQEMEAKGVAEVKVRSYFVELYNDQLVDLYFLLDHKSNEKRPKLEIKLDSKKVVVIKNAVVKEAENYAKLISLFNKGNSKRHVGATKMNAGSSRSHSIFSILIESKDTNTGNVSLGKLTLVDLAGSERADKTGATGDRLQEATSINTSLSALGDVISALCRGDKFIPYRNNKLTQLMQDSIGGNAKTLMFVNISPSDYNASETLSSLEYASRVKSIKNTSTKTQEGEEVSRLRSIIARLKNGEDVDDDEIRKIE